MPIKPSLRMLVHRVRRSGPAIPPPEAARPALELRVHGVSGTPPEELLDRPLVTQVAGDKIAGFYAPRLVTERLDASCNVFAAVQPDAPRLVGYSWGGLTSGSPARALWLLLLPFTLINVAPRARSPRHAATARSTWLIWYLCRLLALALTALFVLAGVGVGEDLIGWQCAGGYACAKASPNWIFHGLSATHRLSVEHMLLIGAAVPTLVLLLLWLSSWSTANRYETTIADLTSYRHVPHDENERDKDTNVLELGLGSRLMWRNANQVRRLRAIHMQTGFATILWTVIAPTQRGWGRRPGDPSGWGRVWFEVHGHALLVVPAAIMLYAAIVLGSRRYTGHGASRRWRTASKIIWLLLVVTGAWEVANLAWRAQWVDRAHLVGPDRVPSGGMPYYAAGVLANSAIALVLLTILLVVVLVAAHTGRVVEPSPPHRPLRPGLGGTGTAMFATLGTFLAAAFTSGSYTYAATWLHTGSLKPGFGEVAESYRTFEIPAAVRSASIAYAVAAFFLLALLIGLLTVLIVRYGWAPGSGGARRRDYPGADVSSRAGRARDLKIRRAMFLGRVVDAGPWLVGPMVLLGLVIVGYFAVSLLVDDGRAPRRLFGVRTGWCSPSALGGTGSYLAVLTLLGLVTLGALAFRARATRRSVGILWDIASFWPRSAHPLAAPCYAERTVPDLITYISNHRMQHPHEPIVLAAHSQGTVISAATIEQLATFDAECEGPPQRVDVLPHLGFMSFGCVLRRLYGRYFPVYFGPDRLASLQQTLTAEHAQLPRWRNLWRYTDYLGGQVTAGPPQVVPEIDAPIVVPNARIDRPPVAGPVGWEWHSPDPPTFERPAGDTTYPRAHLHSDYWADVSGYFQLAVADLADQISQGG